MPVGAYRRQILADFVLGEEMKRKHHGSTNREEDHPLPAENSLESIKTKRVRYSLRSRDILFSGENENDISTSENSVQQQTKTSVEKAPPQTETCIFTNRHKGRPVCYIQKLPNELLTMIFSYLTVPELCSSVAPVCRHWHSVASSPVLWRKLSFCGEGISTENVKKLISKAPLLEEVKIKNSLSRLWLSGQICCGHSNEWETAFNALLTQRSKTLECLQFDASRLKDDTLKNLALCVKLKKLHLHKATNIHSEGLAAIGSLCNLVSLRIHNANHLGSSTICNLFEKGNLKNLIYLSLPGSSCMDDACAEAIAKYCPNLHVLSLALVNGITDNGLFTIVAKCQYIHYLDVFCMQLVSGSVFGLIWNCAPRLNCIVVEEMCNAKKEKFVKVLQESFKIQVNRPLFWSSDGSYGCKFLR
ncbi:hypothetical protein C0J52_09532 [Blattella germanica]|nr:hypothetical protein C0J52_09532 [Blattella germanica]